MSEMVERVKWATLNAILKLEDTLLPREEVHEILARAAIAAMRMPTPKMIAAAWQVLNPCGENCLEKFGTGPSVKEAWQAMIDAAEKGNIHLDKTRCMI